MPVSYSNAGKGASGNLLSPESPTYVMVALNFGATLKEEIKKDGEKSVTVQNVTEHQNSGQSGMRCGPLLFWFRSDPFGFSSVMQFSFLLEMVIQSLNSMAYRSYR